MHIEKQGKSDQDSIPRAKKCKKNIPNALLYYYKYPQDKDADTIYQIYDYMIKTILSPKNNSYIKTIFKKYIRIFKGRDNITSKT